MPKSPEGRAKVRIITRFHDLYLEPPLRALFGQLNPKTRDQKLVGEKLADLKNRIDQLEKMLADGGYACGSEFTLADCALVPTFFFITNLGPAFGVNALDGQPKLSAWWTHVQSRPAVKKALGEMTEALAAMQRGGQ
jgi:glutathione S-transferase